MTKKVLSMLLVVAMLLTLAPVMVFADPATRQAEGGSFADLQAIIDAANDGDTIKLTGDYVNSGSVAEKDGIVIKFAGKTLTIDLNGYTLNADRKSRVLHIYDGNITITSTDTAKLGVITGGYVNADVDGAILLEKGKNLKLSLSKVKLCGNTGTKCSALEMAAGANVILTDVEVTDNVCTASKVADDRPIHINSGILWICGASKIYGNIGNGTARNIGTHSERIVAKENDKTGYEPLGGDAEIWLYVGDNIEEGAAVPAKLGLNITPNNYHFFFVDGGYSVVLGTKGTYNGKYLMHKHGLWDYLLKTGTQDTIVATCERCLDYTDTSYSIELTLLRPEGCDTDGKIIYTGSPVQAKFDEAQAGAWERIVMPGGDTAVLPTIEYSSNGTDWSPNAPTNVGEYTAMISAIGQNGETATATVTFEITPADSSVTTAPEAQDTTYDASSHALVTAGTATGGTMMYKLGDGEWSTDIPEATAAGTYTVYYKVVGDANHNNNDGDSVEVTIEKAAPAYTAPAAKSDLAYTGSDIELITAGSTDDGKMQYSLDQENWYNDASAIKGKNAGNYTVYYKVEGDSNHNDSDVKNVVVTINPADSTFTAPTANTLTYNTNAQALVTAGSTEDGTMKYSLDNSTWSSDIPTGTNAGDYTVYYKVVGDANHNNNDGDSVEVTIEKAAPAYTAPAAKSDLAYTGSDIELITAGSTDDGKMQYSLDKNNWSENASAIKGKNVETYTVYYQVLGDSNHNDSEVLSLNVTVGKSNSVLTTAPTAIDNLKCSASEQNLVTNGTADHGTVMYKLGADGTYSTNIPTAKTAGTYTVYYKVVGDTGYNDIAQSSITVTISHKYDQKITSGHLCSDATCTAKAKYYYSCVCGEDGTATFEDGEALGHNMQNVKTNKSGASTLKTPETCTDDAVYYQACSRCGYIGDTTWKDTGSALGHDFTGAWKYDSDNHWKECKRDASHIDSKAGHKMVDDECVDCHYKTPERKLRDAKEDAIKQLEKMLELAKADQSTRDKVQEIINKIRDEDTIPGVTELREQGLDMIHICRGSHKIEPKEGTFTLKTGGKTYDDYKFTPSNGGWIISKNGNVISGKGGNVWFYQNGVFYQTTTERVSRGFFLWNVLFGRKTVTNTYYLCVSGNTVTAGTKSTQFEIWESFSNKNHTPAYAAINNHQHRIYCYYCGIDLGVENCTFEDGHCTKCVGQQASPGDYIKVNVKTHTTNLLFWKLYYADISAVSDIVGIKKIQYSVGDTGLSYQTGTKVISTKKIDKLVIVVTATDGPHGFLYDARTGLVTRYDLM